MKLFKKGFTSIENTIIVAVIFSFVLIGFPGCHATAGRSFLPSIPGYNEHKKQLIILDKDLVEISGVFLMQNGQIASINDEDGKIFIINPQDGSFKKLKYGRKRDYEDIVCIDNFFYVMESSGNLYRVPTNDVDDDETFKFQNNTKIEFESLYHEKAAGKLVLVSKDHRQKKDVILAFSFDLKTLAFSPEPYYTIPKSSIYQHLKDNNIEFKPSAAGIHPVLNRVFMIASVGKALIQCTLDGKVERAYRINPSQFPQPEGITFATNGDMYISNEGLHGKATLLKFPYLKQ